MSYNYQTFSKLYEGDSRYFDLFKEYNQVKKELSTLGRNIREEPFNNLIPEKDNKIAIYSIVLHKIQPIIEITLYGKRNFKKGDEMDSTILGMKNSKTEDKLSRLSLEIRCREKDQKFPDIERIIKKYNFESNEIFESAI
ncbi:hypothetical protein KAI32_02700 [Candidatus Pacearchaeota archaeon]|nr:hypothetical protein [Candidatus Pacearchaeota archaeon]